MSHLAERLVEIGVTNRCRSNPEPTHLSDFWTLRFHKTSVPAAFLSENSHPWCLSEIWTPPDRVVPAVGSVDCDLGSEDWLWGFEVWLLVRQAMPVGSDPLGSGVGGLGARLGRLVSTCDGLRISFRGLKLASTAWTQFMEDWRQTSHDWSEGVRSFACDSRSHRIAYERLERGGRGLRLFFRVQKPDTRGSAAIRDGI